MKSKKPEAINLPYQSTIANFSKDQGYGQSYLGSFYAKRKGATTPTEAAKQVMSGSGMLK